MPRGNGFENKRVVIVGGSSGIGLAVAEEAASQGADVVIVSSSAERVHEAIKSIGGAARGQAVDVSDEKAVESFFTNLGGFDHLVFTAGDSLQLNELAKTDLKQARRAFELRYWSALAAVKYGSPHIRKGGSIVLTTGIAGQRPRKGWVIAASVCGTIEALTRALAVELAPIRVNAVSPGVVRTNLWQTMNASERERLFESVGNSLPVGRVGEAADIAQAYLFLMQEGFATGQTVVVDGGTVLV
ncbi:MAG TPA: SDR family oxidoreductase [Candidatus Baltobacteraceae bacterium]|jgi:NAD(P)-dependent dehydrogenase (short-subunit alcohol dehydrogenase family)|nr:SDR family oxidoreductase [Candidatus Baltobacteraceae bacterium]